MKLLSNQCDEKSLAGFGTEAAQLIKESNYQELANRFGYSLAFGQEPADVIQSDIAESLSQSGRRGQLSISRPESIVVKFFAPNDLNLFALVECKLPLESSPGFVLAELIVTTKDNHNYVSLEQISFAA
jgi:hypothetical protein